jgi:type III pantothenate kinase
VLLAIDVGNTATVIGVFLGDQLVDSWRIATEARRTADELGVLITALVDRAETDRLNRTGADRSETVTGVAVCSTVPSVLLEVRGMCRRYFPDVPALVVEPGVRTGVPVLTDNPKEVGTDRIVNALAAAHLFGGPLIVVDFGTATTFDAISARGEYLGGAIAPGIDVSVEALGARGAQLRRVELVRPRSVIGKNTVEALQAGIVFGFAGQVDGVVERMAAELDGEVTVVATGGQAPLVLEEVGRIDAHEPDLTLIGLRLIFDRNATERG